MERPLFVATVLEPTLERALETVRFADPRADLVEVRLDALDLPDPEALLAAASRPLVLTCRSAEEGGGYRGSEEDRLTLLRRGIAAGAPWVDVELAAAERLGDTGSTRRILSHHDLRTTPDDLPALLAGMEAHGPDVAKIVTTARDAEDALRLLRLLRECEGPVAAHCLGPAGTASRVLGARFGSRLVYGAARPGAAGAPGQPTLRSLLDDFALERDLEGYAVLVLFGRRLGHSISPRMMNRTFERERVPAIYVPWPVVDAGEAVRVLGELAPAGAAVTIPLKESLIGLLDALDPDAARIGAVNTVSVSADGLRGLNTDLPGALGAIRERLPDLLDKRALLVGAGGAARAVAAGLADAGCRITVSNRTPSRAERLAADCGGEARPLEGLDAGEIDLVVNATPVGQWPHVGETPVPPSLLREGQVVMDAVYNPPETRLLRAARRAGCRVVPGLEMLSRQAALQVEAWLGAEVSLTVLREEGAGALELVARAIVLVGPRGAGKTTLGRLVAKRLDRPFADLDEVIEERAGRSIARIFAEEGKAMFRELEVSALLEELPRPGRVLAVGAGILQSPAAREAVRTHRPRVVYLTAPIPVLADRVRDSARPSLTGRAVEEELADLARRRETRYREVADETVDTSRSGPESAADEVVRALGY